MKKLVNIAIGGLPFQAEEDGYARLESYLALIRAHFDGMAGAEEIASDIEDRLAEQFEAKAGKNGILTLSVVEELLKGMGEPRDFGAGRPAATEEKPQSAAPSGVGKRLMRDKDEVIIAGVCGGVAAYVGVDPVWVRLSFAVSVFFGGFGVVLYAILWIIMPEAKTGTEKMQMRGDPINLKGIERTLKERAEEFKKKDLGKSRQLLMAPFRALGRGGAVCAAVCGKLFALLFKVLGGCALLAGSLAIALTIVAAVSVAFNANSPYVELPLREIAVGPLFYAGVISAFFSVFVPLLFLTFLGAALLAGRFALNKIFSVMLLILWVISLATLANVVIKYAPQVENAYNTLPGYQTKSVAVEVANFSRIRLRSDYQAVVYPSKTQKIIATGSQKDLDAMVAASEDGVFTADRKRSGNILLFRREGPVRLKIYLPKLEGVELTGAARLTAAGFEPREMKIRLSGAAGADLTVKTQKISTELSGASNLALKGEILNGVFKASGSSEIDAGEAAVKNASVKLSGASRARFASLDTLAGDASGASEVYLLSALHNSVKLSGAGKVREQ